MLSLSSLAIYLFGYLLCDGEVDIVSLVTTNTFSIFRAVLFFSLLHANMNFQGGSLGFRGLLRV